jgi:hypothetical protein
MASVNIELGLGSIVPFDCCADPATLGQRWRRWKRSLEYYLSAKGVTDVGQKKALLLHLAGPAIQDVFDTLPELVGKGTADLDEYQKAMKKLDNHFGPQVNVPYERHIFRQMKQEETETVDQFVTG